MPRKKEKPQIDVKDFLLLSEAIKLAEKQVCEAHHLPFGSGTIRIDSMTRSKLSVTHYRYNYSGTPLTRITIENLQ